MIAECPRCGGAIPMDVDTDVGARTRYERGECPRCRFVATTATDTDDEPTATSAGRAIADGGRELEEIEANEVSDG